MLRLIIKNEKTTVQKYTGKEIKNQWILSTNNAWGDIFSKLQEMFPDITKENAGDVIAFNFIKESGLKLKRMTETIEKKSSTNYIFDCREYGNTYSNLIDYIDGRNEIIPNLIEIEKLRVHFRMEQTYLPVAFNNNEILFENLKNPTEIIIGILYYYSLNNLKLLKCKHCEKWFATTNKKNVYCSRKSPCCGLMLSGKKVLNADCSCQEAVQTIKQRFRQRKGVIYNKWYNKCPYKCDNCPYDKCKPTEACNEFLNHFNQYMDTIKETPTLKNIVSMHNYLFSDNMPKQTRPNRRKIKKGE